MYSAGQKVGILPTSLPTDTEAPTPKASSTLRPSQSTPQADLSLLQCTYATGADFCLATSTLLTDMKALEATMRQLCQKEDASHCEVNTWTDAKNVASSYPMTDDQVNTQLAQYKKNNPTNYDCFILFLHGEQIYRSSTCTDPLGSIDSITAEPSLGTPLAPAGQSPDAYVAKYGGDPDTYTEIIVMTDCDALQRKVAISSQNIARETKTPDAKRFQENTGYLTAAQDRLTALVCPTSTPTEISTTTSGDLATPAPAGNCNPAYPDLCLTHDQTCTEIGVHNFKVLPPDPYGLDRDNDGIGCEKN